MNEMGIKRTIYQKIEVVYLLFFNDAPLEAMAELHIFESSKPESLSMT